MPESRPLPTVEYKDFSRRLHERYGQRNRVIKAQLEITYRCNLHCLHCYTDPYNRRDFLLKELSLDEIKRILDEMAALEIVYVNLTGGEVFTRPDFFEIYDYAYHKGLLLMLYSNRTILSGQGGYRIFTKTESSHRVKVSSIFFIYTGTRSWKFTLAIFLITSINRNAAIGIILTF